MFSKPNEMCIRDRSKTDRKIGNLIRTVHVKNTYFAEVLVHHTPFYILKKELL